MRLIPTASRLRDAKRSIVGGNLTHCTPTRRSAEPSQDLGPARERMVVDVARHFDTDETTEGREQAADGEDGERADQGGGLGNGPEEVALHDEQDEDDGAHEQRHHVGRVHEVEGERRGEQQHRHEP